MYFTAETLRKLRCAGNAKLFGRSVEELNILVIGKKDFSAWRSYLVVVFPGVKSITRRVLSSDSLPINRGHEDDAGCKCSPINIQTHLLFSGSDGVIIEFNRQPINYQSYHSAAVGTSFTGIR
jgi:hypothetical protein